MNIEQYLRFPCTRKEAERVFRHYAFMISGADYMPLNDFISLFNDRIAGIMRRAGFVRTFDNCHFIPFQGFQEVITSLNLAAYKEKGGEPLEAPGSNIISFPGEDPEERLKR